MISVYFGTLFHFVVIEINLTFLQLSWGGNSCFFLVFYPWKYLLSCRKVSFPTTKNNKNKVTFSKTFRSLSQDSLSLSLFTSFFCFFFSLVLTSLYLFYSIRCARLYFVTLDYCFTHAANNFIRSSESKCQSHCQSCWSFILRTNAQSNSSSWSRSCLSVHPCQSQRTPGTVDTRDILSP